MLSSQVGKQCSAVAKAIGEELHERIVYRDANLQTLRGRSNARPFITHINAYDMEL